jgi:hypothetical protein
MQEAKRSVVSRVTHGVGKKRLEKQKKKSEERVVSKEGKRMANSTAEKKIMCAKCHYAAQTL